jgi:tripeptidyl-peptidase-1
LDIWWYQTLNTDIFFDAVDSTYCATIKEGPCGGTPLASVISVSWGWYELPGDLAQARVCNEYVSLPPLYYTLPSPSYDTNISPNRFMKIGLLGTSVLFSAGDSGVGSGTCTTFQVLESASCPYITSVGSTMLAGSTITSGEVVSNPGYWSTGGGFSNIWPLPSWQKSAVASYYKSYNPGYTSAQYNNSQAVRGYPDLVAIGSNIMIASAGIINSADGTSASAPIVSSLITMINQERLAAGKSTVGFINPVLYANPSALNDITSGDNPGCGTNGFTAVPGWDPVSGLGSPDYLRLSKVWLALP